MKTISKPAALIVSLALGLALASPADASPRERIAKAKSAHTGMAQRHVDRQREEGSKTIAISGTTADGRTWERRIETVKTEDGYTRTTTGTTPSGETFARTATATRDSETGSWSKDVSGTTPSGKSFSGHSEGQRTEDGFTTTSTHTAPDGTVVTRTVVATRGEDGAIDKDVTRSVTPPQNEAGSSE